MCDPLPHYATGVVGGGRGGVGGGFQAAAQDPDNMLFAENGYIDEQNHILNPLVFTGSGPWPVSEGIICLGPCHSQHWCIERCGHAKC